MIKKVKFLIVAALMLSFSSCDVLLEAMNQASQAQTGQGGVTNTQIISGLKEALKVGTKNAVGTLSIKDGFFKNNRFKIPFPQEVKQVETKLRQIGMGHLVDNFVEKLNRGAEEAVKEASPIFVNAITSMSINDARNILFGADNAATQYFKSKTHNKLVSKFKPKVKNVLDNKVKVTQAWKDVTNVYNKIPGVKPVQTDLPQYVTDRAIQALFVRISEEEKKIRDNPAARVSQILKTVFGELDKK
jgi:hypothetical protein